MLKNEISSNALLEQIIFRSLTQIIQSELKQAGGVDNVFLRNMKALNSNCTFADLPKPLRDAIREQVKAMSVHINSNGFALIPKDNK